MHPWWLPSFLQYLADYLFEGLVNPAPLPLGGVGVGQSSNFDSDTIFNYKVRRVFSLFGQIENIGVFLTLKPYLRA